MKYFLIPLAFAAGTAVACPGDDAKKDAMAPAGSKPVSEAKAAPASKADTTPAASKAATKVAAKSSADQRKPL